jgi:hypothetical protein
MDESSGDRQIQQALRGSEQERVKRDKPQQATHFGRP